MPRTRRRAATALISGLVVLTVAACTSSDPDPVPSTSQVTTLPSATPSATPSETTDPTSDPSVDTTVEPTEDATSEAPADPATDEPVAPPSTDGATVVAVTMSYWGFDPDSGSAFANGYADVVDEGGRCTLSLTNGSLTATAHSDATADATTTSCGEITVPGSQLSSGTWQAVISYASSSRSGQSAPVEIVVP